MTQIFNSLIGGVLVLLLAGVASANQCPEERFEVMVSDNLFFVEGLESSYEIRGEVPGQGDYAIGFSKLPEGAIYDQINRTLTWQPDVNAVVSGETRIYPMKVQLYAKTNPVLIKEKTIQLVILDRPQRPVIGGTNGLRDITNGEDIPITIDIDQPGSLTMEPKILVTTNMSGYKEGSGLNCYRVTAKGSGLWQADCNLKVGFVETLTTGVVVVIRFQAISDGGLSKSSSIQFKVEPAAP